MTLKVVLFDFNGVIINDEPIHKQLIEQILLEENLHPKAEEYRLVCLGRSDRVCLNTLLKRRGRYLTEVSLKQLLVRKAQAYQRQLETLEKLPIYPGVEEFILKLRESKLALGLVTGALRSDAELVLNRTNLAQYFDVIIAGDDLTASKPEPDGYLLAIEHLKQMHPELNLKPWQCLAIEDTFAGIEAAKLAGMEVVGVANTYPFHMLQRQADWTVDYLADLELDRVQQVYSQAVYSS